MLKKLLSLILISLSLFAISCDSSKESEKTCKDNEVLINEECKVKDSLCGELKCTETQECINEQCVLKEEPLCADIACEENEQCIDDICVKKSITFSTYNLFDLTKINAYINLARFISNNNIDIMVNQEIQVEDKDALIEQLEMLGIKVFIEFTSYGGTTSSDGHDYLAIISKWPIKEANTILNETYEDPISNNSYTFTYTRPIHEVKIDVFGEEITIFNLHLKAQSPWPTCPTCIEKRRAQAHALENYIKENYNPEIDKIIIAGDANTATENDEDFETGNTLDILSLKSDNPEVTENDFLPVNFTYKRETTHTIFESLMDHIILSPELTKNYREGSVDVVTPEGSPSDHKAVLLILDF